MPSPVRRIPRSNSGAGYDIVSREWAAQLEMLNPGEEIAYETLKALTGVDPHIRNDLTHSARELARVHTGKIFDITSGGHGFICLSEGEKVSYAGKKLERIHRAARRTAKVHAVVDQNALTPLQKHQLLGQMSANAIVAFATHPTTIRQLETHPPTEPLRLTPAEYQGLFAGL